MGKNSNSEGGGGVSGSTTTNVKIEKTQQENDNNLKNTIKNNDPWAPITLEPVILSGNSIDNQIDSADGRQNGKGNWVSTKKISGFLEWGTHY